MSKRRNSYTILLTEAQAVQLASLEAQHDVSPHSLLLALSQLGFEVVHAEPTRLAEASATVRAAQAASDGRRKRGHRRVESG